MEVISCGRAWGEDRNYVFAVVQNKDGTKGIVASIEYPDKEEGGMYYIQKWTEQQILRNGGASLDQFPVEWVHRFSSWVATKSF